jgi:predicted RNA-binding protein with PUA-like domain
VVSLERIKATPELGQMTLLKRARLSVQPVSREEFQLIRKMGRRRKDGP